MSETQWIRLRKLGEQTPGKMQLSILRISEVAGLTASYAVVENVYLPNIKRPPRTGAQTTRA